MDKPVKKTLINEWKFASNRSVISLPEVAVSVKNVRTNVNGQLSPRKGCKLVTYTGSNTTFSSAVIMMFNLHRVEGDIVMYQTAAGKLMIAKGAS